MSGKDSKITKNTSIEVLFLLLFFSYDDVDGCPREVPLRTYLVLEEVFIRVFNPLREIAEENKCGDGRSFQLRYILYFHVFAFIGRWWIILDDGKHFLIEFGRGDVAMTIFIYFRRAFENFEYPLLGQCRCIHDREIGEWSEAGTYGVFKGFDGLCTFVFHKIPFVNAHDQSFFIFLYERENIEILPFDAACGVDHEYAYIGVFDGAYRPYDRVVFDVFVYFPFFAYAGGIDDIEVESEFIVTGIYRVASRSGYIGNNVSVFADESVDNR